MKKPFAQKGKRDSQKANPQYIYRGSAFAEVRELAR